MKGDDDLIRSADSDPVYSPEASDTDPHGDWQTRVGASVVGIVITVIVVGGGLAWWAWKATFGR